MTFVLTMLVIVFVILMLPRLLTAILLCFAYVRTYRRYCQRKFGGRS